MPRACSICVHENREQINAALVAGEPYRVIAKRFGTSTAAVVRHRMSHLPVALVQAHEALEVAQADSLLEQVRVLQAKALSILSAAEDAGDLRTALLGIGQARSCLELLAKLKGELEGASTTVNVQVGNDWQMARYRIVRALDAYPDARASVVSALATADGQQNGHAH